jgi:hypothetical protein
MLWVLALAAVLQTPAQTASLEGTVTKIGTGDPMPRVQVVLSTVEGPTTGTLAATTDASGKFAVRNIPPGRYRLFASRDGFVRAEYGQRTATGTGKPIVLSAGQQVKDINLGLTPGGTIAGRVYDRYGEAAVNINVQALKYRYANGQRVLGAVQSVRTNDLGEYRLYWLQPGKYIVTAIPPEGPRIDGNSIVMENGTAGRVIVGGSDVIRLNSNTAASLGIVPADEVGLPVYYPGTTDSSTAAPIDLKPGALYGGVDLTILNVRAVHVRGRVVSSVSGQIPRGGSVMLISRSAGGAVNQRNAPYSALTGEFDFPGVAPGSYEIVSVANEPNMPGVAGRLITRAPIEVGSADVENVALVLQPGFSLPGRLSIDGQPPTESAGKNIQVNLRDPSVAGPGFPPAGGNVRPEDGAFTLNGVNPGNYQINVTNLPRNTYVKSAVLAGVDVLNSGLRVDGDPRGVLEIQIGRNPGTFDATVFDDNQEPAVNATVVLVPDPARRQRAEAYRYATTNNTGHVHLDNVTPGDYKAFAWDDVEVTAWQEPDFILMYEDRGKTVRILENGTSSGELRVIRQ